MSNGFCSFVVLAFELAETLKSKLVERDGSQMMQKGMDSAGETSLCSHLCGPWPWMAFTLVIDILVCDSHESCNLCSPIAQIFYKAPRAAFTIQSSVTNDSLCIKVDHQISHLSACIVKLLILVSYFKSFLRLWLFSLDDCMLTANAARCWGWANIKQIK